LNFFDRRFDSLGSSGDIVARWIERFSWLGAALSPTKITLRGPSFLGPGRRRSSAMGVNQSQPSEQTRGAKKVRRP